MRPSSKRTASPNDGIAISVVAVLVGAIRVAIAIANDESFGAEATIGLAVLVLGMIGVAASVWRR